MAVITNPGDHFRVLCTLKDGDPRAEDFEWGVNELSLTEPPYPVNSAYDTNKSCYYYDWGDHSDCCDESTTVTVRCTVKASKYGWREVQGTLQLGKKSFN